MKMTGQFIPTQTRESLEAMTPADARRILELGNQRFCSGMRGERDLKQQVEDTATGQAPFAAILGCIDSRAGAELIFDLGIGDVFHPRIAGNFVNDDILGSLEFACKVVGSKLIVILGHTACGAVKGACDAVELGHLTSMLANIRPAVDGTHLPADPAERNSGNAKFVDDVAVRNVELTVEATRERSEILRDLEQTGAIEIVGAMYDVGSGAVEFL